MKLKKILPLSLILAFTLTACNPPADLITEELSDPDFSEISIFEETDLSDLEETEDPDPEEDPEETPEETEETDPEEEPEEEPEEPRQKLNSADYILDVEFEPIYEFDYFMPPNPQYEPTSYEDLLDRYYDSEYETMNFVRYEILYQYTPEEADILSKIHSPDSRPIYRIRVTYDYLNQKELNIETNLLKSGSLEWQYEGTPPYLSGQIYVSPIVRFEDEDFCVADSDFLFAVHNINDLDFAYYMPRNMNDNIKFTNPKYYNLDMEMFDKERSVITSTINNPVRYTQKSLLDDLVAFFKEDWAARGYAFENTDNLVSQMNVR
ncbi:MAG: hypothetical protein FWG90_00655 [Oscillospiraceae bacterium]|nr:hypothetical protein [Oscillospiraceae bacterium]